MCDESQYSRNRAEQFCNYVPPSSPSKKSQQLIRELEEKELLNDCEILVYGKEQQAYAESVEKKLREMGFRVDVMFLRPEAKLGVLLNNLSALRTTFAVVIHQQHEAHQSLNVHVVETPPNATVARKHECHKNMPLQKALELLGRRWRDYKLEEFRTISDSTRRILTNFKENRLMTDTDYQYLINYIHARWNDQRRLEKKTSFEEGTGISTTEELRKRIVEMLAESEKIVPDMATEQTPSLPTAAAAAGSIHEVSEFQNAVETLMRSNLNPFQT